MQTCICSISRNVTFPLQVRMGNARICQEMIPKMIEAGTDIFRLNCSHRRGGDFERVYPLIRKTAKEMGKKAPWMVCVIM